MGTKLDRVKMSTDRPAIDFVGRANANHGVSARVNRLEGLQPYKAGNLSLALGGAYLGSCYVQKNDFYTSQNVVVLVPKQEMSLRCKQFVATVIFKESQLHYKAFVNELNRHIKRGFSITLPATPDGNPDWDYMESYMRHLESQQILTYLRHLQQRT